MRGITSYKIFIKILLFAIPLAVLITGCESEINRGFTSSIRIVEGDKDLQGSFYYELGKYRVQYPSDPQQPILIVDENKNLSYLIFNSKKAYQMIPTDDRRSVRNDLFQSVKAIIKKYKVKTVGEDKLYGIPCKKQIITNGEKEIYAQWVSDDYPFPLRIEEYIGKKRMIELYAIRPSTLGEVVFMIPENFINIDSINNQGDDPAIKDHEVEVKEIVNREAPTKEYLPLGYQLEVSLDMAKKVSVTFRNNSDGPAICHMSFYRDDIVLTNNEPGPNSYGNVTIKKIGMSTSNTWNAYADKLVVKVVKGKMTVEVSQPDK